MKLNDLTSGAGMVGRGEWAEGATVSDVLATGLCNVETPRLMIQQADGELVDVTTTTFVEKNGKRTLVLSAE